MSQQVFAIFREVTPLVEGLSLDEAYLDVTENSFNESLGVNVARRIKDRIKEVTQLTASAGVAPNKFLAKIASGWKKPDGLTVVAPERIEKFLQGLPVDALWGVGPVTAARLREHGIEKLVDVRTRTVNELSGIVGTHAEWLIELAHGRDDRAVEPNRPAKSAGSEETYATDLSSIDEIRGEIDQLARGVAEWLGKKGKTRAHGDDQGALFGLHHHHPQPEHARTHRRCRQHRRPRAQAARQDRSRRAARPAARRERSQFR